MPAIGQTTTAPGLALPEFGDSGVNSGGANLPGDHGVDLAQGQYDFYAIMVPTNNAGLLRTELQAISGNPALYLRAGAAPTSNHGVTGSGGSLIDRQLTGSVTEYGNWVPLNGQTATNLTPGLWVLSVYASGNANVRFRLQLSCGSPATNGLVQDLPLNGSVTYANQQLAGGDWRYYRVLIPTNAPNNWVVNWTRSHGNAHLFVRDTVPPGDGAYNYDNYNSLPGYAVTWASDQKNHGPYPDFAAPGSDTSTTPPLRPGSTYYLGFWSPDDATFSVGSSTNGGTINITNTIAFYGGSIAKVIPGNGTLRYRLDVPVNATRILLNASNSTDIIFALEQGTVALAGGPAHWTSYDPANAGLNLLLGTPNNYTLFVQVDANNAIYEANLGDKVSAGVSGTFTLTPAMTFQSFSLSNGKFQFTFVGPPGSSCLIEGSTNSNNLFIWVPLLTNTPFNGSLNFVDPQTAQFPGRLYQAIIFP